MNPKYRLATEEDIVAIRKWLADELKEGEGGFFNNLNIIERAKQQNSLTVLISDNDEVLAFCVCFDHTDFCIFEVRLDVRGIGLGSTLARYIIESARGAKSLGLIGDCMPTTSLTFWKKMGFQHIHDPDHEYRVVFPFPKKQEFDPCLERYDVVIELYRTGNESPPTCTTSIKAILVDDCYLLETEYLEYVSNGDNYIRVTCNNDKIYYGKVKYMAESIGERIIPWVRISEICPPYVINP